jgi:hypothetical protein
MRIASPAEPGKSDFSAPQGKFQDFYAAMGHSQPRA